MAKTPTDIRALARAHTAAAIKTLVGIMRQPEAPPAARVSAANSLLDRGWGKAPQDSTLTIVRRVTELTDDELAAQIAGLVSGDAEASEDQAQLH